MSKPVAIVVGIAVVAAAIWGYNVYKGSSQADEVEYRYAKLERGELVRSITSPGQLVALTQVDVKSKAGGIVTRLAVDEGAVVKAGDLIAIIDPRDTQALYDQASADADVARSRAEAARRNLDLTQANIENDIANAKAALESAKIRLRRAEIEAETRPTLVDASLATARAQLASAEEAERRLNAVTIPQMRRDTTAAVSRTAADLDAARKEFERQKDLLASGYVSGASVQRAEAALAASQSAYDVARQRAQTLDAEIGALLEAEKQNVARARASLKEAEANRSQVPLAQRSLEEAKRAVEQAEIALKRAQDAKIQNQLRREEIVQAEASKVRSRVSLDNAKVQLDSTTVVAPRDGVVTMKYIEEGTIIPPGTSTFSQGTSIVQISDVTTMFVDCAVDEADVSQVREGQRVRIVLEAFPGQTSEGVVERVNPSATTTNNITAVKVRVRVLPGAKVPLLPGLSANCEFVTLSKPNVLIAPAQAVMNEDGKSYVRIKTADPLKPEKREVKIGETGNDGVEILSGLEEGEEIVVAEINLTEMRDRQRRMEEALRGGGLAGGQGQQPRSRASGGGTAGAAGGAGGARAGAGGGGR
jgi:HlyD family secretion protein